MSLLDYLVSDDFIAGSIAGSLGIVAVQPLDTVRIRCQLDKSMNMRQHLSSTIQKEGARGLFRGVASPTLSCGFMSAILFQSFESSRSAIHYIKQKYYGSSYDASQPSYADIAIAGAFAGTVSSVITSPTELFKILVQQSTTSESATLSQEFVEGRNLWQRYGFRQGIFRGLHVTMLRDAPAFSVYFPLYEVIVNNWDPYRATQIVPFVGGGLAGMMSWAAVYPMDHIKTLYQTRQYKYGELPLRQAIAHHLRHERVGVLGLYKGLGATLLRCTPQHAVVFVCYEEVKKAMSRQRESAEEFEDLEVARVAVPQLARTLDHVRDARIRRAQRAIDLDWLSPHYLTEHVNFCC